MGGLDGRACEAKSPAHTRTVHTQLAYSNSAWSYYESLHHSAAALGRECQREKGKTELRNHTVAYQTIRQS